MNERNNFFILLGIWICYLHIRVNILQRSINSNSKKIMKIQKYSPLWLLKKINKNINNQELQLKHINYFSLNLIKSIKKTPKKI